MPAEVTAPRQLLKGASYLVTRNCINDEFRLKPGVLPNQIFAYALGRAMESSGVLLHAACVMSSHYHMVVTDPWACLPRFHQSLDAEVARALNSLYGLRDHFWRSGSYNAVLLDSHGDVVDRCAYAIANPVTAGLVRKARLWPGFKTMPEDLGRTLEVERPSHFFNSSGYTPERVAFQVTPPPGFGSAARFQDAVEAAVQAREAEAARTHLGFVGAARVLKQRVRERAKTRKPLRSLKPRFAARDPGRRAELARRLKAFLAEYHEALLAWREGCRDAVFPDGTYQMRVEHLVACAGAG